MIFTSKIDGRINNIIGICRNYGISEHCIKNIKTHNFDEDLVCVRCSENLSYIIKIMEYKTRDLNEILSCDETMIKRLLE